MVEIFHRSKRSNFKCLKAVQVFVVCVCVCVCVWKGGFWGGSHEQAFLVEIHQDDSERRNEDEFAGNDSCHITCYI